MLNSLRERSKSIGHEIGRAWTSLSEGWHELLSHSSDALTQFSRHHDDRFHDKAAFARFPRWSLLAGEVEETSKDILVRLEMPGMDKADLRLAVEGNVLTLSGEKLQERDTDDSTFHVMERAYGAFERHIALPRKVDGDHATATFRNGVLTVRLPKRDSDNARSIPVS